MANIAEEIDWPAGVYQYAIGDVLDGGPDSSETLPIRQLAHRSLMQRVHNVTPWDSVLAGLYGYPVGACVMHSGVSWRAKVANAVEPGTDGTKWERWGYSLDELNTWFASYLPYGAPLACPATGPAADANKVKIYKSTLGEYWMWLGDGWKLVSSGYRLVNAIASNALTAGLTTAIVSLTAPRSGIAVLRGILSAKNIAGAHTELMSQIRRVRGGVVSLAEDSVAVSLTTIAGQYAQARAYCVRDVVEGDVYYLLGTASQNVTDSPENASSIYLEYLS